MKGLNLDLNCCLTCCPFFCILLNGRFQGPLCASLRMPTCRTIKYMVEVPENLKYAKSHEWVKVDGEHGTMGLTSFAVDELGDVVYVELPEVGSTYERGESICTVESVKASSAVYAPVGGEVSEVNTSVKDAPEKLNKDPFGESWLVKLKLSDSKHLDSLLTAEDYEKLVEMEKH